MAEPPSWTDGVQVDERRLQEYLRQKQHTLMLKGAAAALKHTLQPISTTNAEDGLVHIGDGLMLRNGSTGGLLQANIKDEVNVPDGARPATGILLSTGSMVAACPRNVFTVSRVRDDDGFGDSSLLHYGQAFRVATGPSLQDQPLYLFASQAGDEGAEEGETLACLHPRAPAGTHWRALRAGAAGADGEAVRLREPLRLESVALGRELGSDAAVRITGYGNEWRVFGRAAGSGANSAGTWSFVNSDWAEGVVAEARRAGGAGDALAILGSVTTGVDPGELLRNPVARAEHDLRALQLDHGGKAYEVLARLYPELRRAGMHAVRQLRRMCASADVEGGGTLPLHTFLGQLSWFGIRLTDQERAALPELFQTKPGTCDYRRFFSLMQPSLAEARAGVVRDAYAKLEGMATGGHVEADFLRRHWNPSCHPAVQQGTLSKSEALQDFLKQWEITSSDGLLSYDEFLDYYRDVSTAIESDEVFIHIVRSGWGL